MDSYIGPITSGIIDNLVKEIKRKENKEKIINNIIDPLIYDITRRYYPHFLVVTFLLILIIVILIVILFVVLFN